MVSREDTSVLGIEVEANISGAAATLQAHDEMAGAIVRKWDRDARRMHSEMSRVVRGIRGVIRVVQASFAAVGAAIDPVFDAILTTIMVSMTSMLQIHRTLEASTLGLAAGFTIGLSLLNIHWSLLNISAVGMGRENARREIAASQRLMDSLIAVSLPGTFGGGYYY